MLTGCVRWQRVPAQALAFAPNSSKFRILPETVTGATRQLRHGAQSPLSIKAIFTLLSQRFFQNIPERKKGRKNRGRGKFSRSKQTPLGYSSCCSEPNDDTKTHTRRTAHPLRRAPGPFWACFTRCFCPLAARLLPTLI